MPWYKFSLDKNDIMASSMKSIFTPKRISFLAKQLKLEGKKIVVAGGCFDILHRGHVTFLKAAKVLGDVLIIFLESDERIKKMKGEGRPVNTQKDRAEILAALKSVDYVIILPSEFHNSDYDSLVQKIQPDILATTLGDPKIHHKQRGADLVGAEVKYVCKQIGNYSTQNIIQKIKEISF